MPGEDILVPDGKELVFVERAGEKQIQSSILVGSTNYTLPGATVARSNAERATDAYRSAIEDGADPTGATDSHSAIQAALDTVYLSGGGVVLLPAGDYLVSEPLIVHRGCVLRGVSRESSRLIAATGFTGTYLVDIGNVSNAQPAFNCRCENLCLDSDDNTEIGVYSINAQEDSGLLGCRVRDFTTTGIKFESTDPNVLWFDLCYIKDVEVWAGGAATKGIHIKSNGQPKSRVILDGVTVLWNAASAPAGARAVDVEKAAVYFRQLSFEKSDFGLYLSSDAGAFGQGLWLNSGASTTLLYIYDYAYAVDVQELRHAIASGILVNDRVETTTVTGTNLSSYTRPSYAGLSTTTGAKIIKAGLRLPDVTGPANGVIATASGKGLIRDVTSVGHFVRGRVFESRAADDNDASDRATAGCYSPISGDGDHAYKISVLPAGGGAFQDMLSIALDGSATKLVDHAWNKNLFQLGTYYLWVDGSGDLRIKGGGVPSSDTDGTIVGTQS